MRIRPGWFQPVNIFTVVALPPESRKSDVFEAMTRPLVTAEAELIERARPRVEEASLAWKVAEREAEKAERGASSADPFVHLRQLEQERADWGNGYRDHGLVFCWEDGRPIYPDTITEQFNKLVDLAKLPLIKLHDLRHSYATIALRSGVHPKIVSTRLGHATVAFTLDTYSADVPDLDRQAAEDIGGLFLPQSEEKSN